MSIALGEETDTVTLENSGRNRITIPLNIPDYIVGPEGLLIPAPGNARYRIVEQIRAGGWASVFLAEDWGQEVMQDVGPYDFIRCVAIKALNDGLSDDEVYKGSLEREAWYMTRVSDPSLVQIYGYIKHEGREYLIMEYINSFFYTDLDVFLEHDIAKLSLGDRLNLTKKVIKELSLLVDKLAQEGIFHRDLKPANIAVPKSSTDPIKVFDFGIATNRYDTNTQYLHGSYEYCAPEVLQGYTEVNIEREIYSIGVTAYEMLTGLPPFVCRDGDKLEKFGEKVTDKYHSPLRLTSDNSALVSDSRDYSDIEVFIAGLKSKFEKVLINDTTPSAKAMEKLNNVFNKVLSKHPRNRYSSGAEFANDLSEALTDVQSLIGIRMEP